MSKTILRILCALLALMLASAAALAEPEPETETQSYKTYEPLDALQHSVYEEVWVYPVIIDTNEAGEPTGETHLGSGHPGDSLDYTEPHAFVNGVCTLCEYQAETTFTNALGVILAKGMPAADALRQVFNAFPEDANVTVDIVDADTAKKLTDLIDSDAEAAASVPAEAEPSVSADADLFVPVLAAFPAETVDDTPCNVVTLTYTGPNNAPVTENYAFNTDDTTLVKLY